MKDITPCFVDQCKSATGAGVVRKAGLWRDSRPRPLLQCRRCHRGSVGRRPALSALLPPGSA